METNHATGACKGKLYYRRRWQLRMRPGAIAVADMLDREAQASVFSGADAVFVLIPPLFAPSEGFPEMRAILASLHFAIEKAAARRVVCPPVRR
jgi:hypothetical protein